MVFMFKFFFNNHEISFPEDNMLVWIRVFKKDDSSLLDMGVNEKNIENAQKNKTGGFSVQKLNFEV